MPHRHSILLIDDETIAFDFLQHCLQGSPDIEIHYFNDGAHAVQHALECDASLAIVDFKMPEVDGLAVTRALRADPRTQELPIILLSSEADVDYKVQAFELGTNDYLVKWPHPREIESRIRYHSSANIARKERDDAFESLKQSEEKLRESQLALHQAQKMEAIGRLTGGVAHDFNNVLQIIAGNLQMLKLTGGLQDNARKKIGAALEGVERGARLARDLLAFARKQALEEQAVNTAAFLAGAKGMMLGLLPPNIQLCSQVADDLWNVFLDVRQFENVITNLLVNARDAMPNGGTIILKAFNARAVDTPAGEQRKDMVIIEVIDNGKGIRQEIQERVFEPFFTTKPVGKGTGLGLSMAYGFVKQSGGNIVLDSTVDAGTRVRIELPRTSTLPADGLLESEAGLQRGCERILVVDDEQAVRESTCELLHALGYQVFQAENAERAAQLINQGMEVDLLFTDVVMPGNMTCLQLVNLARAKSPGIKVLFTSGFANNVINPQDLANEEAAILQKPYSHEDLTLRVRNLLDLNAMRG